MLNTITVRDLITVLQSQDLDAKVVFTSNYGDRGQTAQAHAIRGHIDEGMLTKTAYSESGYAVDTDEEHDREDEEGFVLVIR